MIFYHLDSPSDKLRKSSCCQQLPISARSISGHFLEHPIEMLGILKAQFIGYLVYGLLRIGKQVLGRIYDFALDVFLRILSRFLFNQVSEKRVSTSLFDFSRVTNCRL